MSDNCDNYNYYDDTGSNSTQGSGSFDNWANPSEPRRIEGFFEDDVRAFVGNNADKYLERFHCITRGQKPYNWCSALFSASWMIYRKMWKPALALAGHRFPAEFLFQHVRPALTRPVSPLPCMYFISSIWDARATCSTGNM